MSGSNLPPGVTTSMLPGNRPEDVAEEEFWEAFDKALEEAGFAPEAIEALDDDAIGQALTIARDLGYKRGRNDGLDEAGLAEYDREQMAHEKAVHTPGTEYSRVGPLNDPIGRLADFARFAVRELDTINHRAIEDDAYRHLPSTQNRFLNLRAAADDLADLLSGYTTAADE